MNALIKSFTMVALTALILGTLGFYEDVSHNNQTAKTKIIWAKKTMTMMAQIVTTAHAAEINTITPKPDALTKEALGMVKEAKKNLEPTLVERTIRSELRIKTHIKPLEKLPSGLTLYSYKYRADPTTYVGLMANNLAASETHKFYVVHMGAENFTINYDALNMHQITLAAYRADGPKALSNTQDPKNTEVALNNQ